MKPRKALKEFAERVLVYSGVTAIARLRLSRSLLILSYHNVVPDGAPPVGDLPNHLPLSTFRAQLDALESRHRIVPLDEALRDRTERSRPRVAITFDDAYLGAVRYGIQELARRGLPATVFVAPAFIGGRPFWWDTFAGGSGEGLDPGLRESALLRLRGEDRAIRSWANERGIAQAELPDHARAASEDDLRAAASVPGITLGSHTWSHPNLTRLDRKEVVAELRKPLDWLRERFDSWIPWVAYPYGCFDADVARYAEEVGYVGGLGISGGWISSRDSDPLALPRLNIPPGLSARGFRLRAAGIGA